MPGSRNQPARPLLTVLTPTYNEEENVREVHRQVRAAMETLPDYDYEHLFIDNASTDGTVEILRQLAAEDHRVKAIVNTRNFGHIRSPSHGMLQARGDAVMTCVADLQDPPDLLPRFVRKWEEGYKVVIGVKNGSHEAWLMYRVRRLYYWLVAKLSSDVELVHNFTGFGLYDREVVEQFRATEEQYPYFRGLVSDFGYERAEIKYLQPARIHGHTKNNFFSLYDLAMLGITSHSKVPLRLATMAGFVLSVFALLVALAYLILKLAWWQTFDLGLAPLVIGVYFLGAVQLFFVGLLGEYIGSIHTQVHRRPLVVEKERIGFDATETSHARRHGRRMSVTSMRQGHSLNVMNGRPFEGEDVAEAEPPSVTRSVGRGRVGVASRARPPALPRKSDSEPAGALPRNTE